MNLSERKEKIKQQVLSQGRPSVVSSVADAIVIKNDNTYFLCNANAQVPLGGEHGLGLYYKDCRYLSGYELRVLGSELIGLTAESEEGDSSIHQLCNPNLIKDSEIILEREKLGVEIKRSIDHESAELREKLSFTNFSQERISFDVSLRFEASFEDIFIIRGLMSKREGHSHRYKKTKDSIEFIYEGVDEIERRLKIQFSCMIQDGGGHASVNIPLTLEAHSTKCFSIRYQIDCDQETSTKDNNLPEPLSEHVTMKSDSALLNRIFDRSMNDLKMLRSRRQGYTFIAAGVPWFCTLFGRDSLISAIQTMAFDPGIAKQTLMLLAKYQGKKVDQWKDEEPGKILHELRSGELTQSGQIPYDPYYGTVDATPLFLITIGLYVQWTGDLKLFHQLEPNIEAALNWLSEYGDKDGEEYITYKGQGKDGLINQGWKDAGDSIVNEMGDNATPPIAVCEAQAYAYRARLLMANLYRKLGQEDRAKQLIDIAHKLRDRFNKDFWVKDLNFYALAIEKNNRLIKVISSNPGHALWSGIADEKKAEHCIQRLMQDDMYSDWGVRTLSELEKGFNPVGYHVGTVWPHDNSIIAAGFKRYGADDLVCKIFEGLTLAASYFKNYRLPEVFSGLDRESFHRPVPYPVACHPQAWAAGSIPLMLQTLLGISGDAFEKRLYVDRPVLPKDMDYIEIYGVRVGPYKADLRFERKPGEETKTRILNSSEELEIIFGDVGARDLT